MKRKNKKPRIKWGKKYKFKPLIHFSITEMAEEILMMAVEKAESSLSVKDIKEEICKMLSFMFKEAHVTIERVDFFNGSIDEYLDETKRVMGSDHHFVNLKNGRMVDRVIDYNEYIAILDNKVIISKKALDHFINFVRKYEKDLETKREIEEEVIRLAEIVNATHHKVYRTIKEGGFVNTNDLKSFYESLNVELKNIKEKEFRKKRKEILRFFEKLEENELIHHPSFLRLMNHEMISEEEFHKMKEIFNSLVREKENELKHTEQKDAEKNILRRQE